MLLGMITGRGKRNVWPPGLFHSDPEVIWSFPYSGEAKDASYISSIPSPRGHVPSKSGAQPCSDIHRTSERRAPAGKAACPPGHYNVIFTPPKMATGLPGPNVCGLVMDGPVMNSPVWTRPPDV
jgi:hypothetical protein